MEFLKKSKIFAGLVIVCLLGIAVWIYSNILFVFRPLEAIFSSVFLPVLISIFIFYIFLPFFNWVKRRTKKEKHRAVCDTVVDRFCSLFDHSGDWTRISL